MGLLERFLRFGEEHDLISREQRTLLAVSGGRDSVLMVHLFAKAKLPFGIAHCNFQLRGQHADADEELVSNLAAEMEVPLFVKRFDTIAYARKQGISIEMAARALRYEWFEQIRLDQHYRYIALAHHQNDSVETVLLNLTRGTGIAGLHGILPKRGVLIRPLLFLTREEVTQTVLERNLVYREDESNFSTDYLRNKIRLEVVPRLKEINPSLERTFQENSRRFEEMETLLKNYSEQLRKKLFVETTSNTYQIELKALQELKPLRTLLYELFRPYQFLPEVLDDLVSIWQNDNRTGKQFFSDSYKLLLDRENLILQKKEPVDLPHQFLQPNQAVICQGFHLTVKLVEKPVKMNEFGKVAVDADKLLFPLLVRSWQEGDWFKPLGMKGKKKLSDFFISLKISRFHKKEIPLLVNGNGDIVWVVPHRMDDRYKITDKTKKVAILECI
ncbi:MULTISPECIES: tRNA lysidine(34) synthetase TilS [Olivibacter]|jgi:tRNA(Ile)-lysidine synthase|uniref:tRNA(Ile)-lysidine synthase n=2 Tax=Olivibacter TaxID=376469 RepID=A0ABV6HGI3_9SPHI|nr:MULTISPECIES: tRNA lysidine(34) synthetase TilS [Olivibacter]QEL00195.1 tRNA lysidine(34) synthetase TilS [Olivibacter sp. LS-1]